MSWLFLVYSETKTFLLKILSAGFLDRYFIILLMVAEKETGRKKEKKDCKYLPYVVVNVYDISYVLSSSHHE